ncbi:MAG: hypothetical protein ABWZ25_14660 [Chitinophagaceae bacterium]
MSFQNQPTEELKDVRHIREMMERSSRFLSLSGLSGVSAGVFALAGAFYTRHYIFPAYYNDYNRTGYDSVSFDWLRMTLLWVASLVFFLALASAFYFTWRRSRKQGSSLWNITSRRLFWNTAIPIAAGACFIIGMLWHNEWRFVAPASLMFYGLALVNASKYTLTDIRYLGLSEIALGLLNMFWIGYGLYFWAFGFGILHILYGIIMWVKYERKS